jgi:methionyl-tRNA formyltransferase
VRLIFAGTPPFAAAALAALADTGHDIPLVLTQPDRPAGRGMKLTPCAVKLEAQKRGLAVAQPASLKTGEAQTLLRDVGAEVMVVAAYGLILPQAVLDLPARGCLNIHASLLPRWRGAAPIQRALLAGDAETGITIMQMDTGLDTGAMLLKSTTPISDTDTAGSLHDRLMAQGATAIIDALARLDALMPEAQDATQATYATKLSKEEARLDWTRPATDLARAVRGYNPVPGAWTLLAGAPLKLWSARVATLETTVQGAEPGTVLAVGNELLVATGRGALAITELQPAGAKRMSAAAFCAGHTPAAGGRLG